MIKSPKVHLTKSGKRYFIVNGRKIFIESGMTKAEINSIYKVLLKSVPLKTRTKNINKATAVIKQYINTAPVRRRRTNVQKKDKKFVSTIDEANRVTKSGNVRDPKDSGKDDEINGLINQKNLLADEVKKKDTMLLTYQDVLTPLDNSDEARLLRLQHNDDFNYLYETYFGNRNVAFNVPQKQTFKKKNVGIRLPETPPSSDNEYGDSDNKVIGQDLASQIIKPILNADPHQANRMSEQEFNKKLEEVSLLDDDYDQYAKLMHRRDENDQHTALMQHRDINSRIEKTDKLSAAMPIPILKPKSETEIKESDPADLMPQPCLLFHNNVPFLVLKYMMNRLHKEKFLDFSVPRPTKEDNNNYRTRFIASMKTIPNLKLNDAHGEAIDKIHDVNRQTHKYNLIQYKELFDYVTRHKSGKGQSAGNQNGGLYDDQIDTIMKRFPSFLGCIMRDQIKTILPYIRLKSRIAFIINTDTHDKPEKHWDSVYVDARDGPESSNSMEWFDSFARPIPPDVLEDLKLVEKCLKPSTILKLKENRVVKQSDDSSNCGYFACSFLIDRFRNMTLAEATGYNDQIKINDIKYGEKDIEKRKEEAPFIYILPEQ